MQAAIDDTKVKDNDTIYIAGTGTSYGAITLNKTLTLIGTGHHPNKDFALNSEIGGITFAEKKDALNVVTNTANGSRLLGLEIASLTCSYGAQNIEIKRCYISSTFTINASSKNWQIEGNYIDGNFYINNASNIIISSNILGFTNSYLIYGSNQSTVIISNNLFLRWSGTGNAFLTVSYATISNNIFYGIDPSGATNCTFNNNIAVSKDLPYALNTGANNINLTDPGFVNVPAGNYTFDWAFDYHLKLSSLGHNKGTDNKDIGPFGGSTPLSMTGEPAIPVVMQMILINPTLPENGTLEIKMKARIQN